MVNLPPHRSTPRFVQATILVFLFAALMIPPAMLLLAATLTWPLRAAIVRRPWLAVAFAWILAMRRSCGPAATASLRSPR